MILLAADDLRAYAFVLVILYLAVAALLFADRR